MATRAGAGLLLRARGLRQPGQHRFHHERALRPGRTRFTRPFRSPPGRCATTFLPLVEVTDGFFLSITANPPGQTGQTMGLYYVEVTPIGRGQSRTDRFLAFACDGYGFPAWHDGAPFPLKPSILMVRWRVWSSRSAEIRSVRVFALQIQIRGRSTGCPARRVGRLCLCQPPQPPTTKGPPA